MTLVGDPAKDMEVIWNKTERLMQRFGSGNMEEEEHDKKEVRVVFIFTELSSEEGMRGRGHGGGGGGCTNSRIIPLTPPPPTPPPRLGRV